MQRKDPMNVGQSHPQAPQQAGAGPHVVVVEDMTHPQIRKAFRSIRALLFGYLALGVITLGVIVVLRNDAAQVNSAVWTRGSIVVVTAVLLVMFTARAARGSAGAYRRLRVVSVVTPVAIAGIIAVPGGFPLWMKVEQGVCGLVMIAVAVIANGPHLRGVFAARRARVSSAA